MKKINTMRYKSFFLAALLLTFSAGIAMAQNPTYNPTAWGPSHGSAPTDCMGYQFPTTPAPCPDAQIKQKHDHTPMLQYRSHGWDTTVTCKADNGPLGKQITLSCTPYLPVQKFNGYYAVDQIPYDPADTTFSLGTPLNDITQDDAFSNQYSSFDFPFYFFGISKDAFRIGANGLVTFCSTTDFGSGNWCPYSFRTSSNYLPWTSANGRTPDGTTYFNRMHDAIYGVYEDTDPRYFTSNWASTRNSGIYYGTQGVYPCRKIVCSWKEAPDFGNNNDKGTYQIVCYEGSNMIEVHIKKHQCCPSTSDALIGIQNADGLPQTTGPVGSTNMYVQNNAHPAFYPANRNGFTDEFNYEAWRFTPQGQTQSVYEWYRILDDGTNVPLSKWDSDHPDAIYDTNGYYRDKEYYSECKHLTLAYVSPKRPSRYVFHMFFIDASGLNPNVQNPNRYDISDTILVGVDTTAEVSLHAVDSIPTNKNLKICSGTTGNIRLDYPAELFADTIAYSVSRYSNGQKIDLRVDDCLFFGQIDENDPTTHTQPITLRAVLPDTGVVQNKIDSLLFFTSIEFTNGCPKYDSMWLCIYPNFDITIDTGICQPHSFYWDANGQTYSSSVQATAHKTSTPGCDSTVHLNLTVFDKSYTVDHVVRCKEFTWINDSTYYESNNTAKVDTTNRWGCDSTVQLDFKLMPVTARIQSDRDFFDFDHLDAVLTDISLNNHSRKWLLNDNLIGTGTTLYYSIQPEADEARIYLVATSDSGGCVDTTNILIPMRKESFWMPNIFTPGRDNGNNLFGSISSHTLTQEMFVYNRNGQLVFRCDTPDCKWDGRDLNGNNCPQGTYTYLVRYTNEYLPKVTHVLRGTVTLIR